MNMFEEKPIMTREEWYRTPDFIVLRFLNNMASSLGMKAQEMRDVLELIAAHRPDITFLDRFTVVERQLRVVSLEAKRLWDECRKLDELLSPRNFSDLQFTPSTSDSQSTTTPPQPDQHQG